MTEVDDGCPCIGMVVTPEARIVERVATNLVHRGGLGHHEAVPADRQRAEPLHVPGIHHAVIGRVPAHEGDPQPVLDLDVAEGDGAEEERHIRMRRIGGGQPQGRWHVVMSKSQGRAERVTGIELAFPNWKADALPPCNACVGVPSAGR